MIKTINRFDAIINSLPQKGYVVLHINKEDEQVKNQNKDER